MGRARFISALVPALVLVACGGRASESANAPAPDTFDAGGGGDGGARDTQVHVQGDAIQRMCVFGSCASGFPTVRLSLTDCLSEERFRASAIDTSSEQRAICAVSSTTCAEWTDCMTFHHGDYCKTHPGESCFDNVAFHCSGPSYPTITTAMPENCAVVPGLRCNILPHSDLQSMLIAGCTTDEDCTPAMPPKCAGTRGRYTCYPLNDKIVYTPCNEPLRPDYDVAVRGSRVCGADDQCLPVNTPCTSEGVKCSGTVATDCRYSFGVSFDCAKSGQTCRARGRDVKPDCAPVTVDCDPSTYEPSCTSSTLKLCVNGRFEVVDCAAYGFGKCLAAQGACAQ